MKTVDHRKEKDCRVPVRTLAFGAWLETADGRICEYDAPHKSGGVVVVPVDDGAYAVLLEANTLVTPLITHEELHIDGEGRA